MKEKDAFVDDPHHRLVLYVEKPDGTYGAMQTGAYMIHNYLDDFQEKRRNREERALAALKGGRISPVGYYMDLLDMTLPDVAARVGVSRRAVQKHRTPRGFATLRLSIVREYALVFGIPVADLFRLCRTSRGMISLKGELWSDFLTVTDLEGRER